MPIRFPIVIIALMCLLMVDLPGALDSALGYPRSPSQSRPKNKGKKQPKVNRASVQPTTVPGVAISLRNTFGQIAAGKLPQAILECEAAEVQVNEAQARLLKLQREVEMARQATRVETAGRVIDLRRDSVQVNKDYAVAMLRIQERLKTNSAYRSACLQLEKARSQYDSRAALSADGNDAVAALGEVGRLEAQTKEMESEALNADKDAMNAKAAYDELKQQYKEAQRDLYRSNAGDSGRRQEIADAYEALMIARRAAASKARIVAEYKGLIHTATYQKPIVGFQLSK